MNPIDIAPADLKTVQKILADHVPDLEVRAFGARVSWNARANSDLDLALMTAAPLDIRRAGNVRAAFAESSLPFRVDVVDWASTAEEFQNVIERQYAVVQSSRQSRHKSDACKREMALKDVAEVIMGQSPPGSTYNEMGKGLPFFQGVKDFTDHHPVPRIYCDAPARVAGLGDVLLSVRAPIGRVNIADRECAAGRGLAIIRLRSREDGTYLEYWLRYVEPAWNRLEGSGSVFANATKKDLENLVLPWPNPERRHYLVHILGTLDSKIALNCRMNRILEGMARALFKLWFVDFGPVRAKMEGHWRAGQSLPGMPRDLYDLFPDRLVDSELGAIPEGWAVKALGDCFRLTMGPSPLGNTYNDDRKGVPFFQGSADFGLRYPENRKYCIAPTRMAQAEDTLVSVRAPVGAINMAWEPCCIGHGVAALRHNSGSSSFTYYAVGALQSELQRYEHTGTVFGAINGKQFKALRTVEPLPELVECFTTLALIVDNRIRSNVLESRTLAMLRDRLLPVLVSGSKQIGK